MEKLKRLADASIRMGEMTAAADGQRLRTLLGSCVGLALFDRRLRVGGLAHIVLPAAQGPTDRPGKFVDTAVPTLIDEMKQLAGCELKLTAKLAGGASMFPTTAAANIGSKNIQSCEQILARLSIPVIARHCGGEQGRRMIFDTGSGNVVIELVGQDPIEL